MTLEAVFHVHPEIMSGAPVFVGTRVPVRTLLDYLESGDSLDDFLEDFPGVQREQAVQFLEQAAAALPGQVAGRKYAESSWMSAYPRSSGARSRAMRYGLSVNTAGLAS